MSALNDAGLRTLALDFRGHGDSRPSASKGDTWSYDDSVREDVPALCAAARERWPNDRSTLIGHSLGGHVSLASVSTSLAEADAMVLLATNIWLPQRGAQSAASRQEGGDGAVLRGGHACARLLPVPHLGFGSDDEPAAFMEGWTGWWKRDRWTSDDQAVDYRSTMGRIRIPILSIASSGDRYLCTASGAAQVHQACAGRQHHVRSGATRRQRRHRPRSHAARDHPRVGQRLAAHRGVLQGSGLKFSAREKWPTYRGSSN